jgi:hypothetical protein
MLEFALHDHQTLALGVSWPHWMQKNAPVDRLVLAGGDAVNGIRTPVRVLGVWTHPHKFERGKTFSDAREGVVEGSAWGLFEAEKLIRMALAQSVFAFEFLTSHALLGETRPFDTRKVLRSVITQELVDNLVAESTYRPWNELKADDLRAAAAMLVQAACLSHGVATLHVPTALKVLELEAPEHDDGWRAIESKLKAKIQEDRLPRVPGGRDEVFAWLESRMAEVRP